MASLQPRGNGILWSSPDQATAGGPLLVFFGGIPPALPRWMWEHTPKVLLQHYSCAFVPFQVEQLSTVTTDYSRTCVFGFSRGGINALDAYGAHGRQLKFVGFIDPSFRLDHLELPFGPNCGFMGPSEGMMKYFQAKEEHRGKDYYPDLMRKIAKGGGLVIDTMYAKDPRYPNLSREHLAYPRAYLKNPDLRRRFL